MARTKVDYGDMLYRMIHRYVKYLGQFKEGDRAAFTKPALKYLQGVVTKGIAHGIKSFTKEDCDGFVRGDHLRTAHAELMMEMPISKIGYTEQDLILLHETILDAITTADLQGGTDNRAIPGIWTSSAKDHPDYPIMALMFLDEPHHGDTRTMQALEYGSYHLRSGAMQQAPIGYDNANRPIHAEATIDLKYPTPYQRQLIYSPYQSKNDVLVLDMVKHRFMMAGFISSTHEREWTNSGHKVWTQYDYVREYMGLNHHSYRDRCESLANRGKQLGVGRHHLSLVAGVYRELIQLQFPKFWDVKITHNPARNTVNPVYVTMAEVIMAAAHRLAWTDEEVIREYWVIMKDVFHEYADSADKKAYYKRLQQITIMNIVNHSKRNPNKAAHEIAAFFDGAPA